ncbi:hypothetical protein JST97_19445 [bacterium]|nr:hypothetical protein [bacterium]
MITFPASFTVICLLVIIGVAFLPAKLPTVLRNILIQVAIGVFIYFALGDATFNLPNGDHLPMSGLFGGYIMVDPSIPLFNNKAFGVIAPILGIVFSVLVGIVRFIISRKKGSKSDD